MGKSTHGMSRTRTYRTWADMIQRCTNPKTSNYADYGGRGITVCERWLSFANFYADMGDPAPGLSLDRIDVDAGYSPENCRWATQSVQNSNQRRPSSCRKGHEFDEANTFIGADGRRRCRKCIRARRKTARRPAADLTSEQLNRRRALNRAAVARYKMRKQAMVTP